MDAASGGNVAALLLVAALLFLLQTGLSVALVAGSALSRVALHRLANGRAWLAFLGRLREPASAHRMAAALLRQLCLLSGVTLVA
jgi:hypothetical protein